MAPSSETELGETAIEAVGTRVVVVDGAGGRSGAGPSAIAWPGGAAGQRDEHGLVILNVLSAVGLTMIVPLVSPAAITIEWTAVPV